MSERQHPETPEVPMPPYLEGLEPPVSVEEALEYAEARGATPEILRFMEGLPAAVYTSEEGMRNALASARPGHVPESDPEGVLVSQDGTSS